MELKLGDVPYVYSIIPLSQTANTPIFELSYATGVRGNQTSSVENYKKYLNTLAENLYMVNNSSSRKRYASPKAGTELYLDLVFRQ